MRLAFEDHPLFHRTALRAALGAVAMALIASLLRYWTGDPGVSPILGLGALASIFALRRAPLALLGAGLVTAVAADQWRDARQPLLATLGLLLALGLAEARLSRSRAAGEPAPSPWMVALAAALCAGTGWFLPSAMRPLGLALGDWLPPLAAWAALGALAGCWFAAASAPLHLRLSSDPVEAKLSELRSLMLGELRPLVDRVAAARRAALHALQMHRNELSFPAVASLRGELDGLALAALDLARRGADLGRAAPASFDEELTLRAAELHRAAAAAPDALAQASYRRAAETLDGQLDHLRVVRRGKERIAARLHEEVAQLERARFSLVLLQGDA